MGPSSRFQIPVAIVAYCIAKKNLYDKAFPDGTSSRPTKLDLIGKRGIKVILLYQPSLLDQILAMVIKMHASNRQHYNPTTMWRPYIRVLYTAPRMHQAEYFKNIELPIVLHLRISHV